MLFKSSSGQPYRLAGPLAESGVVVPTADAYPQPGRVCCPRLKGSIDSRVHARPGNY